MNDLTHTGSAALSPEELVSLVLSDRVHRRVYADGAAAIHRRWLVERPGDYD